MDDLLDIVKKGMENQSQLMKAIVNAMELMVDRLDEIQELLEGLQPYTVATVVRKDEEG